jgi:dephospho-CoA kinase
MKYFDVIIFIKANKHIRLKRFKANGGNLKTFNLLNNRQIVDSKKAKFSDFVVVNEKNLYILKKKLSIIMNKYE